MERRSKMTLGTLVGMTLFVVLAIVIESRNRGNESQLQSNLLSAGSSSWWSSVSSSLFQSSSSSSWSYRSTYSYSSYPNYSSSTAISFAVKEPEICEYHVVNGIISQCCRTRYSIFYTCRHFADTFDRLCAENGIQCWVLSVRCGANGFAHAVNIAIIDGKQCIVEPQGSIVTCDIDTPEKWDAAMCQLAGLPNGCSCTTELTTSSDPSDFTRCALNNATNCDYCCKSEAQYHIDRGDPEVDKWLSQCLATCTTLREEGVQCDNPLNCVKDYTSDPCNPTTCLQSYNTGRCRKDNPGACLVIQRTCEDSSRTCGQLSSSSNRPVP